VRRIVDAAGSAFAAAADAFVTINLITCVDPDTSLPVAD
jgi:hypothetical protein